MLSLSLAFHLGSAALLIVLFLQLAKYRRWMSLLRRWSDPASAGVLVGEPCRAISDFAAAMGIGCEGEMPRNENPVRLSLAPLFSMHTRYGIRKVQFFSSNGVVVSFVLGRSSATIEEDQRTIELAFAKKLQIQISGPTSLP